ncbi:hypothetical protein BYT27DRAFT_7197855 [Phlegmacium glaucopus]|nr:hypothetical protein BYT27DRAFT_7197855 [Phlegmacium glaucopus]
MAYSYLQKRRQVYKFPSSAYVYTKQPGHPEQSPFSRLRRAICSHRWSHRPTPMFGVFGRCR